MPPDRTAKAPSNAPVYFAAFLVGAVVMAFEMVGSRYLTPYFGSSVFTWGSIISATLLALAGGYFLGGVVADRFPSPFLLTAILALAAFLFLPIPRGAAWLLPALAARLADARLGSLCAALALILPPLLLLGMFSPFSVRLALHDRAQAGRIAGLIYAVSTIGSIFGTLGAAFYLIPTLGVAAITYLLAGTAYLSGVLFFAGMIARRPATASAVRGPAVRRQVVWLAALSAIFLACAFAAVRSAAPFAGATLEPRAQPEAGDRHRERCAADNPPVAEAHTAYTDIAVRQNGKYRSMHFYRRSDSFQQSCMNIEDARELPMSYARVMTVSLAYADRRRSMAMIGLGGGSLPKYLHAYLPELEIDNVELDPGVIALAQTWFGIAADPRFHVTAEDGRLFLKRQTGPFDLIAIDAFRAGFIPFHMVTREFYELVKSRLAPGGVVAVNLQFDTELFGAVAATIESVFGAADYYPEGGLIIIVARAGAAIGDAELRARARALQQQFGFRYDLPVIIETNKIAVPAEEKTKILTDDFAPAEYLNAVQKHNDLAPEAGKLKE
jgi:spermidine synthase